MAASQGVSCNTGGRNGAALHRGLEPGSIRLAIVRNRYQATATEDIAGWKRLSIILQSV
jgi:hypothetical protein